MIWEYGLVCLVVGIIIGAVAMRFGSKAAREGQNLQYELKAAKEELADCREELAGYFAHSAELLDKMAHDYRQLYRHMAKSSGDFLRNLPDEQNPFIQRLQREEMDDESLKIVQTPRDYSYRKSE